MKLIFPNGEHGELTIQAGTLSIGRAPGNDVLLDNPGIADQHARLVHEALGLVVRPAGEADVYLNGRRVTDRAPLRAGDVLGIHKVQIRVQGSHEAEAVATEPEDSEAADPTKVRPAMMNYYLRGVSGDSFGRLFTLSARTEIGRDEDCEIVLKVDEVSRRHARIEVTPAVVTLTDLGSANGTFVNGERLRTAHPRELKRNDEIAFDTLRFRFESTVGRGKAPRPASKEVAESPPAPVAVSGWKAGWVAAGIAVVILLLIGAWFAWWV